MHYGAKPSILDKKYQDEERQEQALIKQLVGEVMSSLPKERQITASEVYCPESEPQNHSNILHRYNSEPNEAISTHQIILSVIL